MGRQCDWKSTDTSASNKLHYTTAGVMEEVVRKREMREEKSKKECYKVTSHEMINRPCRVLSYILYNSSTFSSLHFATTEQQSNDFWFLSKDSLK